MKDIAETARSIAPYVCETPLAPWPNQTLSEWLGGDAQVLLKLELLQRTGTFKARGALSVVLGSDPRTVRRGLVTASAGNHAIATAYAARTVGVSAKVLVPRTAAPFRLQACRALGAEVVMAEDDAAAFAEARRIAASEGRLFIHPFDGPLTALGAATLGLELSRQAPVLDAVVVAVGGGGLIGGVAAAVKQLRPACRVYGVEPVGASNLRRSLDRGEIAPPAAPATIADSLAPPQCAPFSFQLCRSNVDEVVLVDDLKIRGAMRLLFHDCKLAVEPAGAAATAAVLGPLRGRLAGKTVAIVVCGSNIDLRSFQALVEPAAA